MLAFVNTKVTKAQILEQLRAHAKADELVQGYGYWADGKGCAVGCTVHSDDHEAYETQFGIPQMLARLEDAIFEGLPVAEARKWPVAFMSAIEPGTDLSRVGWQFLHWLLTDKGVNPGIDHPLVRDAIKRCADVLVPLTKGKTVDESAAQSAWSAAQLVARSAAESAAESAWSAWSAARSAAESAAESAWSARSAAWSADSAARSAWSAAQLVAESAAESAWSAWSAAQSAAYVKMSKKLISLLKAAK